jgi:hypothetical protein
LTIAIPLRTFYHLEDVITLRHLQNMGKILLATGMIVGYGYLMETFMAFYGGNQFETYHIMNRMFGRYAPVFWILVACNVVVPQMLWFNYFRSKPWVLFAISLAVNLGMWLERYMIVVVALHRDYMPSAWGMYQPTIWDITTFVGSMGLFVWLMFLFIRFLPMISIAEMRTLLPPAQPTKTLEERHEH